VTKSRVFLVHSCIRERAGLERIDGRGGGGGVREENQVCRVICICREGKGGEAASGGVEDGGLLRPPPLHCL
jgi:hypothetical protein